MKKLSKIYLGLVLLFLYLPIFVLIAFILCVLIKNTVVLSFFRYKVLYNRGIVQNIVYDNRGTVQFL